VDRIDEPQSGAGLADLSGEQIGRYLIDKRLGSGGVATVYQAYDQVQGRTVAFKVLAPTADLNTLNRFRREALTSGSLRHPNIVRTLQVGTAREGEIAYIAMELVEGESLADLLTRQGKLRAQESCNLLEPIARGLAFAHRSNIIHRDVKPSNILLQPSSLSSANNVQLELLEYPVIPMLSDFGVARVMDAPELTNIGRTVGTPAYMAPEQCSGSREIDGRADIYALGTVLYRCVVGRLPFSGTTTQILHAHVYAPLTIDDHLLRQLPPIVVDILRRSLAKRPESRYAQMSDMADELALAAGRQPIFATAEMAEPTDATATLTLSALPAVQPDTTQVNSAVLVPAPDVPEIPEPAIEIKPPHSQAPRAGVMWRWAGLAFAAIAIVLFSATVTTAVLPLLSRSEPEPTGQVEVALVLPSPTPIVATADRTADSDNIATGGIGGDLAATAVVGQPASATTDESDGTSTVSIVAISTAPVPEPTQTEVPPVQPLVALSPSATVSPLPTASATATALPTETPNPTPTPTVTPTAMSTIEPADDLVFACSYVAEPIFGESIRGMDAPLQDGFRCPTGSASVTTGAHLPFQHGFMLQLDNDERIFVYYDKGRQWEWTSARPPTGEPDAGTRPIPPSPDLAVPEGVFGQLWSDPQRQTELGFAATLAAAPLSAVIQKFPGGILVGDQDGQTIYQFFDSDLTFR